ncbi:MAG: hypothetical protein ABIN89_19160 [Chitinophagaceae bacterium]
MGITLTVFAALINIVNVSVQKKEISNLRPRLFYKFKESRDLTKKDSVTFILRLLNHDDELPISDVGVDFGNTFNPEDIGVISPNESRIIEIKSKLDSDFVRTSATKPVLSPEDKQKIRIKYNGTKEEVLAVTVQPQNDTIATLWDWFDKTGL